MNEMNDFFDQLGKDYLIYRPETINQTKREVRFYLSQIGKVGSNATRHSILDMCCGYGRHALLFALEGHKVTGVDACKELIEVAKDRVKKYQVDINYLHDDIRHFRSRKQFTTITILGHSFGFFNFEENLTALRNLNEMLSPDGNFILEIFNRDYQAKRILTNPSSERSIPGGKVVKYEQYIPSSKSKLVKVSYETIVESKELEYTLCLYNFDEVVTYMSQIGLSLMGSFADHMGSQFDKDTSPSMILIFKKGMIGR